MGTGSTDNRCTPFDDAAAVSQALNRVQERVEAQKSAGVEAVRTRAVDRAPGQEKPDDLDKKLARELLKGSRVRGRRKRKQRRGVPLQAERQGGRGDAPQDKVRQRVVVGDHLRGHLLPGGPGHPGPEPRVAPDAHPRFAEAAD